MINPQTGLTPNDLYIKDGWAYVLGEHPISGDHVIYRFEIEHMFKERIPFQQLFTWERDEGVRA